MTLGGATNGLLDGIKVLDLSRVLAGPFAGQVLAEMGADVTKVEAPEGDPARAIGPYLDDRSLYFSSVNTGKRGIMLDLRDQSQREVLEGLIAEADVLLHNLRPGAASHLGLDAEGLRERHPHLVIVALSSFSRATSRSSEPAYDLTIQAESGLMAVTGEPGRPPVRVGAPIADLAGGLWAALAAVSGVLARTRDGSGTFLEIPLFDATLPFLSYMATAALASEVEPARVGSGHHSICPYGAFATKDGWIVVAVLSDKFWGPLCKALGLQELAKCRELRTNADRVAARDRVDAEVGGAIARLATDEALQRLKQNDVPSAPVLGLLEALRTDYVTEAGMIATVRAAEGEYGVVQGPLRDGRTQTPAPGLGEQTHEVLDEI